MLDIDDALTRILNAVDATQTDQTVALNDSLGHILADDIYSHIDVPPADNSAMDGYALNSSDGPIVSITVSQRIAAGKHPAPLTRNTLARIFTGAEVPAGADCVVVQENCQVNADDTVSLKCPVSPGDNIRRKGQDIANGDRVLTKGHKIRPQDIGVLAAVGIATVKVKQPLKVAILCSGDELVAPGAALAPGQIYNSNQAMITALVEQLGGDIVFAGNMIDTFEATCEALTTQAAQAQLVITTGGVSVGEEDHIKKAIEHLGSLNLWKIRIKPGKPLALGDIHGTPILGLPGNPVSAFVTFALFAIPLMKKLQGQRNEQPLSFRLPANFSIARKQTRPEYIRVKIHQQRVDKFSNQSSGVLSSLVWGDALALIPADTAIQQGDPVTVFPIDLLLR